MDTERTKRLQAILKWSLRQQEEGDSLQGPTGVQMNTECHRWLQEALEYFSTQPNETDLLKAALTLLKVHVSSDPSNDGGLLTDEQQETLEEAFEQVKYFIEDLDHANDLIPLKGVETIVHYLNSENMFLIKMACELVAVASQNNPNCQDAFLPTMRRLLLLANDSKFTEDVKIQAVRAISSLSRSYEPGLREFLTLDGLSVIISCLNSRMHKVTVKSLFMLSDFYSVEQKIELQGILNTNIGQLLSMLAELLSHCEDSELLEHLLSVLSSLLQNHLLAVKKHLDEHDVKLKEALLQKKSSLSPVVHKDEYEKVESLIRQL